MLVGAMHAGCRVLNFGAGCFDGLSDTTADATSSSHNDVDGLGADMTVKCTKMFTEHESMTYGADWLVCPHPTQNGYFEAAARYDFELTHLLHCLLEAAATYIFILSSVGSCSFYDRAVFIWDSVF
jgi:hypothetical protein